MQNSHSNLLFLRAQQSIPGGVNSPVRAFRSVGLNPLFIKSAAGSRIIDVDNNEFIDYVGSWGPMILGHGHAAVLEALRENLDLGISYGAPTEAEIDMAELIKSMMPNLDMVRMVNSGTEATMSAIRVARGFTGRDKIIKFAGCYHGHADYLLVKAGSGAATLGSPDSPGVPASFAGETLIAEYNNLENVRMLTEQYPDEIAAIILEPVAGNMGVITPKHGFLSGIRELCDREGIVLIFDEVMTGFRVSKGGAQELYHIMPDLTTLGKIIGGGLPVGAYGGRLDIMQRVSPMGDIYQAGTLSGNPLAMCAGLATLKELNRPGFYEDIGSKTNWLVNEMRDILDKASIPFRMQSVGGMFGLFFIDQDVYSFTDALNCNTDRYAIFFREMLNQGIYLAPSAFEATFMSAAHSESDLEKTRNAFKKSIDKVVG
ncbi:MAG: glutamate-1-semialdehyde 2,1-aminomutase [Deltaproteobacteria bacterium]|nr:glutamate-1-semialdehyde 2,1-aminomutase [Deltaproteobacteria bacterium]MBT4640292.1 glutamate-1-semialdehyde 2,1-aminomutase [Deltaproteobacteria bacterium]MBT7151923.1 glutamate-1-semialdehyde 2,1-aminomutase [Deltaproteobacteria bacterium]